MHHYIKILNMVASPSPNYHFDPLIKIWIMLKLYKAPRFYMPDFMRFTDIIIMRHFLDNFSSLFYL